MPFIAHDALIPFFHWLPGCRSSFSFKFRFFHSVDYKHSHKKSHLSKFRIYLNAKERQEVRRRKGKNRIARYRIYSFAPSHLLPFLCVKINAIACYAITLFFLFGLAFLGSLLELLFIDFPGIWLIRFHFQWSSMLKNTD